MIREDKVEVGGSIGFVKAEGVEPEEVILHLFRTYEPLVDLHLWPWESKRWHELVFCLLTEIVEPEISAETVREVTRSLTEWHLLDIERIAVLRPKEKNGGNPDPVLVTIGTILQQAGFAPEQAERGVAAICEAAAWFDRAYAGKVQGFFRKYGTLMLDEIEAGCHFKGLDNKAVRNAFSIWLQNTLNMPLPVQNSITEWACKELGVHYSVLVKVADDNDINVALLDEALRACWANELKNSES